MDAHTEELVRRAHGGDAAAYDRLFEQVAARVLVYIRCRLGPALAEQVDALDVLQEAYLEAHRSFASFTPRGAGSFVRWLCGVADHRLRDLADHHGAKKRRPPDPLVRDSVALARVRAEQTSPSSLAGRHERDARLVAAVDALAPEERDAVLRRYFKDETLAEIAAAIGKDERSVRRLLAKATSKLGDLLAD